VNESHDGSDVDAVFVDMKIGGEVALFILLASDGLANRMGTGAVDNTERDLFIGKIGPEALGAVKKLLTPAFTAWLGQSLADPNPRGPVCELAVGVRMASGKEMVTAWRYGAASLGPPAEIRAFVTRAVELTDPWYAAQKAMAGKAKRSP
jgi:hypothetical protein